MEFKDYYKIMGLSPEASQEEIKRTYRKLARKYHPDVSKEPDAETRFKEIGEAYEVLKDNEKRARYDVLRKQGWQQGDRFEAPPHWQRAPGVNTIHPEDLGAFSDFFESLFGYQPRGHGPGFRQAKPARGEDIYYTLPVDLKDAYAGATSTIEIPYSRMTPEGRLVPDRRKIRVKIPQGVTSGQQIRLRGQGGPSYTNGPAGDLYLNIELQPSALYDVEGRDIIVHLPITPWEAALGSKVKIPTLGGVIEMKIPPNSQTGTKLRLKGRGLPGNPQGDQYVNLQIVIPPVTDSETRDLYQQMADKIRFNPREKLGV